MTELPRASLASLVVLALVAASACSSDPEDDARPGRAPGSAVDAEAPPAAGDASAEPPAEKSGPSCANGAKDGDETDVDCGGATCPPCATGSRCARPEDCVTRSCTANTCSADLGCADGTREAFTSIATFPNIAGCAGAWSVAGLVTTTMPACKRAAGNSSANANGTGCNVADLCQIGWHVCATAVEVGTKSGGAGCAAAGTAGQGAFYVTRQSGAGGAACGAGTNDLFGCGDVGIAPDAATCGTLDRFSNDLCVALPPTWACGGNGAEEANQVVKTASAGGGVLCCRD